MAENLFEVQYDVTKKTKLKKFYESNKILIFSFISILVILFVAFSLYMEAKEKKMVPMIYKFKSLQKSVKMFKRI